MDLLELLACKSSHGGERLHVHRWLCYVAVFQGGSMDDERKSVLAELWNVRLFVSVLVNKSV